MPQRPASFRLTEKPQHAPGGQYSHSPEVTRWRASKRWTLRRAAWFASEEHQFCAKCGLDLFAVDPKWRIIHHIVDHRGDYELFWSESNWQSLCKPCHDSHTAKSRRL